MREQQRRAYWLEAISDLMARPLTEFPSLLVCQHIVASFEVVGASWDVTTPDGTHTFDVWPPIVIDEAAFADAERDGLLWRHPLIKWYAAAADPRPWTNGRVPSTIATKADHDEIRELLRPGGAEHQLSIPIQLHATSHRAIIVRRAEVDFSDEDLALATMLQPLLRALDRQASVLAHIGPGDDVAQHARATQLTVRELAVLRLLADGHTSTGIALRLMSSPRTVEKHLEHIYRKLRVRDRLTAIRIAELVGLVEVSPMDQAPASHDANPGDRPRAIVGGPR
jgi:DNA-binding NarL/FixJ family response regulator